MGEILPIVVTSLGTLFGAVITYYLVPLLKQKAASQQNQSAVKIIQHLVNSAEQVLKDGTGAQKKDYVMSSLKNLNLNMPESLVDAFLESAVKQMNDTPVPVTSVPQK